MERRDSIRPSISITTSPLTFIESLPHKEAKKVWNDVLVQLTRLEGATTAGHTLPLLDKIEAAKSVEISHQSIRKTAQQFGVHPWAVSVAIRDVRAASYFVQQNLFDNNQSALKPDEQHILERLIVLDKKAKRVDQVISDDRVIAALEPLPHLLSILRTYSRYLNLNHLLESVGIQPSRGHQKHYYNNHAESLIFFNSKTKHLRRLARRYLFGVWLKTGKNWYGKNINMAYAIANIFLPEHEPDNNIIMKLRRFFEEILFLEFEKEKKQYPNEPEILLTMFPTNDGKPPKSFDDVNLQKSWRSFESNEFLPECFVEIIKMLVLGETSYNIAQKMNIGKSYNKKTIEHWFSAATTFFENILLLNNCQNSQQLPQVTSMINQLYQKAQETIKTVAKELQPTTDSPKQEV